MSQNASERIAVLVRVPAPLLDEIDELRAEDDEPRAAVLRRLIRRGLKSLREDGAR